MADKRCVNGHYIDESWDLCPYCPQEPNEGIAIIQPGRDSSPTQVGQTPPSRPLPRPSIAYPMPVPRENTPSQPADRTVVVRGNTENEPVGTKRYVVGWLVALSGAARGESFAIRMGRNVLGRDRRADIFVNDDQASSHHADLVFRPEEGRFILMDHNSTNGTYVNEAEIEPRRDLLMRDIIRIGGHRFLFVPLCSDAHMWDSAGELK